MEERSLYVSTVIQPESEIRLRLTVISFLSVLTAWCALTMCRNLKETD